MFNILPAHISYYTLRQSVVSMTFHITCESNYIYKSMNLQMSYELHRLYSFNNSLWKPLSGKHSASVLAHIGFYYSGRQAVVVCYKCLCTIDCSDVIDSADAKHRTLSPRCLLVIGNAADNVLLVHPEEVMKKLSAYTSLLDTADRNNAQTVAVNPDLLAVERSLLKTTYAIFTQAYLRSQKRGVFADVNSEVTPVDRNNPDFDRLR